MTLESDFLNQFVPGEGSLQDKQAAFYKGVLDGTINLGSGGGSGGIGIVGPGRPDMPSSTDGAITGEEPVGTVYNSTDGGGTGAIQWIKTGASAYPWKVTVGNTGNRFYSESLVIANPSTSLIEPGMRYHGTTFNRTATGASVDLMGEVIADNPWIEMPSGFEASYNTVLNVYEDRGANPVVWQYQSAVAYGKRWFRNMHPTTNSLPAGKWITTTAIYNLESGSTWPTILGGTAS